MKKLLSTILFLVSFYAHSSEHAMTNFRGGDVELKSYDHGVAGSVREAIIFANNDEEKGITKFIAKKDGKIINAEIKTQTNGSFGTFFDYTTMQGENKIISVTFKSLDREKNKYLFIVNGKEITISVKADDFKNNHYINPQYDFQFEDKVLSVKMENGEACYNFSAHLIAIVLTAYTI
jgi:hypothetical protein